MNDKEALEYAIDIIHVYAGDTLMKISPEWKRSLHIYMRFFYSRANNGRCGPEEWFVEEDPDEEPGLRIRLLLRAMKEIGHCFDSRFVDEIQSALDIVEQGGLQALRDHFDSAAHARIEDPLEGGKFTDGPPHGDYLARALRGIGKKPPGDLAQKFNRLVVSYVQGNS